MSHSVERCLTLWPDQVWSKTDGKILCCHLILVRMCGDLKYTITNWSFLAIKLTGSCKSSTNKHNIHHTFQSFSTLIFTKSYKCYKTLTKFWKIKQFSFFSIIKHITLLFYLLAVFMELFKKSCFVGFKAFYRNPEACD